MKPAVIIGFILLMGIMLFLFWGLYYHQPQCLKECEATEINGEMEGTCHDACYYFIFDFEQIWFFNWRIK